jgi:fructokinase
MKTNPISTSKTAAIGIDLGGSKTESILFGSDGTLLWRQRNPTPTAYGYDAMLKLVVAMIQEAADQLPAGVPFTVGIGIPGSVDSVSGLVRNANSTCLIGHPLRSDIERLINSPIQLRNDADCFTLAECHSGAGEGYGLVFGVIMGTGCGGGICINGDVREGPHRISGEWGHLAMDRNGVKCYCGNRGCVETLISGSGVEAAFFLEYSQRLTMNEIVAHARAGEPRCLQLFERFLDDFGRCLGGLISILDPDAVVLGGGLSNIEELYTIGRECVRQYAFHDNLQTPILRNKLGDSAGVFGAAWIGQAIERT